MSTLFDLTGKVALITGSSRGIGRAIAERMAEHGARVVISSRKAGPCEEVVKVINDRHGEERAIAVPANISEKEDLQRLVDATNAKWGRIDIVVCNAASNPFYGPMEKLPDDAFRKILDNNIVSNHWLIQMTAPQMRARKDGCVIIVSSIGGVRGEIVDHFTAQFVTDADLERFERVEHIEFGQCDAGDARNRTALADQHGIEPPAAALASGHGAEFMAPLAQLLAGCIIQFGRKRS